MIFLEGYFVKTLISKFLVRLVTVRSFEIDSMISEFGFERRIWIVESFFLKTKVIEIESKMIIWKYDTIVRFTTSNRIRQKCHYCRSLFLSTIDRRLIDEKRRARACRHIHFVSFLPLFSDEWIIMLQK